MSPPEFSDEQYEVELADFYSRDWQALVRSCDLLGQTQSAAPRITLEAQKEATLWEDSHTEVKSAGRSVKLVDIDERRRRLFALYARAKNPARVAPRSSRTRTRPRPPRPRRAVRARARASAPRAPGSAASSSRRRSRRSRGCSRTSATACGSRPRRRGARASTAPKAAAGAHRSSMAGTAQETDERRRAHNAKALGDFFDELARQVCARARARVWGRRARARRLWRGRRRAADYGRAVDRRRDYPPPPPSSRARARASARSASTWSSSS